MQYFFCIIIMKSQVNDSEILLRFDAIFSKPKSLGLYALLESFHQG